MSLIIGPSFANLSQQRHSNPGVCVVIGKKVVESSGDPAVIDSELSFF